MNKCARCEEKLYGPFATNWLCRQCYEEAVTENWITKGMAYKDYPAWLKFLINEEQTSRRRFKKAVDVLDDEWVELNSLEFNGTF